MIGCDAVVHLAAHLGVRRTEVNKLRCLEINIDGTKKHQEDLKWSQILTEQLLFSLVVEMVVKMMNY